MASTQTSVRRWVASRTSSSLSPPSASHSLLMPNLLDLPHITNQKSAVRQCRDARQPDPQILLRDLVLNARAQELRSYFHQFDVNTLTRAAMAVDRTSSRLNSSHSCAAVRPSLA